MKTIANPIDAHVGQRIRLRRQMLRMELGRLAQSIGVTPNELELFETGMSRIGAARLKRAAIALNVEISFFFSGIEASQFLDSDPRLIADALELNRAFFLVRDPSARRRIVDLANSLAAEDTSSPAGEQS